MRRLGRAFFDRPCLEVARALVGTRLVHELPGGPRLVGRVVEVEAYVGDGSDPGSHGHLGPTPRNRAMFGPPGHLYCYRSYGLHTCVNVVAEREGRCAAVLLRAIEPIEGVDAMTAHRGGRAGRELSNGPGKLCSAFAIGLEHYGLSVVTGPIHFLPGTGPAPRVGVSTRIGLTKGRDHPWRYFDVDSAWVGAPRDPLRVLRRR